MRPDSASIPYRAAADGQRDVDVEGEAAADGAFLGVEQRPEDCGHPRTANVHAITAIVVDTRQSSRERLELALAQRCESGSISWRLRSSAMSLSISRISLGADVAAVDRECVSDFFGGDRLRGKRKCLDLRYRAADAAACAYLFPVQI